MRPRSIEADAFRQPIGATRRASGQIGAGAADRARARRRPGDGRDARRWPARAIHRPAFTGAAADGRLAADTTATQAQRAMPRSLA